MKANAPEKIYIHEASAPELTEKLPYHIEYVRTDAFMKKSREWLTNFYNAKRHCYLMAEDIDNFINYMEGE